MEKRFALVLALSLLAAFLVSPAESAAQPQAEAAQIAEDTTPPVMLFVNDDQTTLTVPGQTVQYSDRLYVAWKAEDNESGIKRYRWALTSGQETIMDFINSNAVYGVADGLSLEDGKKYVFKVSALNNAGQWSRVMTSQGVEIEVRIDSGLCADEKINGGETGIDCGGNCLKKCTEGDGCKTSQDCESGLCSDKICVTNTCEGDDCTASNDGNQNENDYDGDGIPNDQDNCDRTSNPEQKNQDEDEEGDECDEDDDNDGMTDLWEINYQLDPLNPDDATWDNDSDTLSALEEFGNKTSPLSADTDQDGHNDAKEIRKGTDPNDPDSKPGSAFLTVFMWLLTLAVIFGVSGFILREKLPPPAQEFIENKIIVPVREFIEKRKGTPMQKTGKEAASMQPANPKPAVQTPARPQAPLQPFNMHKFQSRRLKRTVDTLMHEYGRISGEQVFKRLRKHAIKKTRSHKKE